MNHPQTPQPWEQALSAQKEITAFIASPNGKSHMAYWVNDRRKSYGAAAASPSEAAFTYVVDDLIASEAMYVTSEMMDLTYKAMETFRRTEPVIEEDFFLKSGFIYLAKPFHTYDIHEKKVAHRAISWRIEEMSFTSAENFETHEKIEATVRTGIRIILWSHVDDPDDYGYHKWDETGWKWGISHATTMPLEDVTNIKETSNEGDMHSSWLTFLRVMNRLMAERIVVRSRYGVRRALRREMERTRLEHISDVIVVELRKRTTPGEPGNGGPANYSHQFIVGGHWRNQWYPSLGMHRQKWISDYVKGPEDKPLIIKEKVWIWDR